MQSQTLDSILNNKIKIKQNKLGYRFSIDALLLYNFIHPKEGNQLLEIGTGCGIISILLAMKYKIQITAVEIQESLAELARENISQNQVSDKIKLLVGDINSLTENHHFSYYDIIFVNPPYKEINSGRINPDREKAIARHQIFLDFDQICSVSAKLLKNRASLIFIYKAKYLTDIITIMKKYNLRPVNCRFIHGYYDHIAKLVLMEAKKNCNCKLVVEKPCIIYEAKNNYTIEIKNLLCKT